MRSVCPRRMIALHDAPAGMMSELMGLDCVDTRASLTGGGWQPSLKAPPSQFNLPVARLSVEAGQRKPLAAIGGAVVAPLDRSTRRVTEGPARFRRPAFAFHHLAGERKITGIVRARERTTAKKRESE